MKRIPSILAGAAAMALLLGGCTATQRNLLKPGAANRPEPGTARTDPEILQVRLQRFADDFATRTVAALDEYARHAGTPEARKQALTWKIGISSVAVNIVSGPNPTSNLIDLMSLASAMRLVLEEWVGAGRGPAFEPWHEVSRVLETNAWNLAEGVFSPEQQQEVRDGIRQWWEAKPEAHASFLEHPQDFGSLIRKTGEQARRPGSVFALIGLDPMAGLDPAAQEIARTRLFAERALYSAQRMPFLLRWQSELLAAELLGQGHVEALLESTDRISRAAESLGRTAEKLPERVTAEREALVAALDAQEGRLRELSAEVRRTLTAAEAMSTSLNTTLITFDALMKRFGVGEPDSGPPDTNAAPFNILDYAQTADRMTAMARELGALIKDTAGALDSPAFNQRLQQLTAVSARAKADAKSLLNHAFLLGAGLVLLAFGCAVAHRRLGRRGATAPGGAPAPARPDPL